MKVLTMGTIFSGIGGWEFATSWLPQIQLKWQIENNRSCRKILQERFPGVTLYGDIHHVKKEGLEKVDIIAASPPCQPYSNAGNRRGHADHRHLWPKVVEIVEYIRPAWAIIENVPGLMSMGIENLLVAMESGGYETQTYLLPACGIGAPHERKRVFVVAHLTEPGLRHPVGQQWEKLSPEEIKSDTNGKGLRSDKGGEWFEIGIDADADGERCQKHDTSPCIVKKEQTFFNDTRALFTDWRNHWWEVEPPVDRVVYGVSRWVDGCSWGERPTEDSCPGELSCPPVSIRDTESDR